MKRKQLGVCQFCGHPIYEYPSGWGCSENSGGCGATIFRGDKFFSDLLGVKVSKHHAVTLLTGKTLKLYGVTLNGDKADVTIDLEKDPKGVYKHHYICRYMDQKKKEQVVTAFDLLNE
jgi:hypothetical protein